MLVIESSQTDQLCREELAALLHSDCDDEFSDPVLAMTGSLFDPRTRAATAEQRCSLAYTRLRVLGHRLGSAVAIARDPRRLFALQEASALIDGTLHALIAIHYNLCLGTIVDHLDARPDLIEHVRELDTMRSIGVFLATELGYGNNVAALETQAQFDPDSGGFILHTPSPRAWKFMPNTAFPTPKLAVVMARLYAAGEDCGVFPFVVRIRDSKGLCPGIRVAPLPDKPGLDLDNAMTHFDRVRLPRSAIMLGEHSTLDAHGCFNSTVGPHERFTRAMSRVTQGKLGVTGAHLACARAALDIAVRYALQRLTYAPDGRSVPIMAYANHQRALLGGIAQAYALTLLLQRARTEYLAVAGRSEPAIDRMAAVAKALGSWTAQHIVLTCRERCGAQGMFSHNHIADYVAVGHSVITSEGDNEVIAIKAGQEMVLGRQYTSPPLSTPDDAQRRPLDKQWWLALFRHREAVQQRETLARVNAELQRGAGPFDVWNAAINHCLALTKSHGLRLALECLLDALDRCREPQTRNVLAELAAVFALMEIERDAGWFLAHGVLSAQQFRELPTVLDDLYTRLAPRAPLLVDAFGVPDRLLRTPIASPDYVEAYRAFAACEQSVGRDRQPRSFTRTKIEHRL
jgi:acyl-CoA oxidase